MPAAAVISWPSVPVEIVRAAGLRPVVMRGHAAPTPAADAHLEPDIFPSRLRHLVDAALTGRLADAACIVIPRTSDADYKCFLYLRELERRGVARNLPPVILFDLLQSSGPHVGDYDASRTKALCDELAAVTGAAPSTDDLQREIAAANAARAAARRLVGLRRGRPRLAGTEAFPLLAAFWDTLPDEYATSVNSAAAEVASRPALPGPRVLLTGAAVDAVHLHAAIESHDAVVVAEAGPYGSEAAGEDVACTGDPILALADRYRADPTSPRTPVTAVRQWTERALEDVDAVVVSLPPHDTVYGWDYPGLRRQLDARSLPHACLRGEPCEPPTRWDQDRLRGLIAATRHEEPHRG
jgi:benzoyl-CoA reductase/2-hydroxyglutaryl-CoA dehydratase subunit BcrC/BadD/HgdB